MFTACEPPKGIAMCGISMSKSELEFAHASGPASARRNRKLSRAENIAKPVSIELFGVYIAMSALSSKTGQAQNDPSSGASHPTKILLPFPSFVRDLRYQGSLGRTPRDVYRCFRETRVCYASGTLIATSATSPRPQNPGRHGQPCCARPSRRKARTRFLIFAHARLHHIESSLEIRSGLPDLVGCRLIVHRTL